MKRKSKQAKNEIYFIDEFGGHHYKEYTEVQMNDYCPLGQTRCGHPHQSDEWMCFGRWRECKIYNGR